MKVNFYATLRKIAGQKTIEFDLEHGMTGRQLLDMVLVRFPDMREELVDSDGNLYGHVHLFVNGRDSRFLENALDTTIKTDDKIDIFPAVGGGSEPIILNVNFYASLRKISGKKTVGFPLLPELTGRQLLQAVITRFPEMSKKLLNQNGELDRHAHIYINGRNCPLLADGLDTKLETSDIVNIFPIGHF